MKKLLSTLLIGAVALASCTGKDNKVDTADKTNVKNPDKDPASVPEKIDWKKKAADLLNEYNTKAGALYKEAALAYWDAALTGKFDKASETELAFRKYHSDKAMYDKVMELQKNSADFDEDTKRTLKLIELGYRENVLEAEELKKLVNASKEIEKIFSTFRGKYDGAPRKKLKKGEKPVNTFSNNELLSFLKKETNSLKRQKIWEGLKDVGEAVGPKLVALAKLRNDAAKKLGFKDFWHMRIVLQEHDPDKLVTLFDDLQKLTDAPFKAMKDALDKELARKFRIKPAQLMPWHYDNPFFQEAPPSAKVNLDEFFKNKKKEDIVAIAKTFFNDIDLNADDIIERSDYYEKPGKDQHAFCTTIDRENDVRMLLNIRPNVYWMDTMLHETGHAVYYKYIDRSMNWTLREAAHIFTTEAVAMFFGALSKNIPWLTEYLKAPKARVKKLEKAIIEQRIREQLIFARWTLVMFNFEKALYENPDQDLNKLWWDLVEKYQFLKRPVKRNKADWASKPHFTIAPVYYHNYLMGELFAAQLRATFAKTMGHKGHPGQIDYNKKKEVGKFMKEKLFASGMKLHWGAFVKSATGEELSSRFFAEEVKNPDEKPVKATKAGKKGK